MLRLNVLKSRAHHPTALRRNRCAFALRNGRTSARSVRVRSPPGGSATPFGIATGAVRGVYELRNYLVDPASSHMLVSKIKPCMPMYTLLQSETANGSLNQLWFLRSYPTWITAGNSRANTCTKLLPHGKGAFIRSKPIGTRPVALMTLENLADRMAMRRRRIFQMSALSTVDGTCYAYHGCNG